MDRTHIVELSLEFTTLAEQVAGSEGSAAPLRRVAELAVTSIQGCRYATLSTVRGKYGQLLGASHPVGELLEKLQNELGEGPTPEAARLGENLAVDDLCAQGRWPRFGPAAIRATGVGAVHAYRLAGAHPNVLTLWGCEPGSLAGPSAEAATVFVGLASSLVALVAAVDHAANLQTALVSSREIGMALGVLMAHRKVTGDAAFDLLRTASQNLHRKLRDVAGEVMQTGTLPELPVPASP